MEVEKPLHRRCGGSFCCEILSAQNRANEFFHEESYSYNGRILPMYLMNRDEFSLLAMGFTGKKALQWNQTYL